MRLTQPLHKGLIECPDATMTVHGDRTRSHSEFVDRVARLAGGLRELGAREGDRIGILGLNSDRYIEAFYAILWAGCVVNPVNIRWSEPEVAYSIDDCQTRFLLVDDAFISYIPTLRERTDSLETVVFMGNGTPPEGTHDYHALATEARVIPDAQRQGDDLAGIFYTGGTTGKPKGVMLSHGNLYSNALSTVAAADRPKRPISLHAAPLFHIGGLGLVLQSAVRLGTHVTIPQFDPKEVLTAIERHGVQETFLVPTMLRFVMDHPDFKTHDLSSIQMLLYGASPMDGGLLSRALEAFPGVRFAQAFGMTELSPVICILPPEQHSEAGRASGKLSSAGPPVGTAEVRIVDSDDQPVPYGTVGEIVARGPMVMQGYWNKPDQTAEALRGGWMHTGDGGYMDEDGYIHVVDRIKDMIVTGGENVYSAEVEEAVLRLPQVAQCAVIGIPDEQWGERVHAAIVLHEGEELTHERLMDHCKALIASYKCPRSMEIRDALPMSGAGKLLKYKLREDYSDQQARDVS